MPTYEYTGNTSQLGSSATNYVVALKIDPTETLLADRMVILDLQQAAANGSFTLSWADWAGRIAVAAVDDDATVQLDGVLHDWLTGSIP